MSSVCAPALQLLAMTLCYLAMAPRAPMLVAMATASEQEEALSSDILRWLSFTEAAADLEREQGFGEDWHADGDRESTVWHHHTRKREAGWQQQQQQPSSDDGVSVASFNWTDCSPLESPVRVRNFSLTPDPLVIPGKGELMIRMEMPGNLADPLVAQARLYKYVRDHWVIGPCLGRLGSCNYPNLCELLKQAFPKKTCPPAVTALGISCHCPIANTTFPLEVPFVLPGARSIPPSLLQGLYRYDVDLQGNLTGPGTPPYHLCLSFQFRLVVYDRK